MCLLQLVASLAMVPTASANYGHEEHGYGGGHDDGYGHGGGYDHSVNAAVKSKHSVHTYPVHSSGGYHKTPVVDIHSGPMAIKLRFNSYSSHIHATQKHHGSPGKVKKSYSVDHPDILIHKVKKPVIQEVKEIITPYRKRIQVVKPVKEKVETIIATGHHGYGHGGGHGYGHGGGGHGYGHGGGDHGYGHGGGDHGYGHGGGGGHGYGHGGGDHGYGGGY